MLRFEVDPAIGKQYALVVVDVKAHSVDRPFHYKVPEAMRTAIAVGMRVLVPFGARPVEGYVIGFSDAAETEVTRPIDRMLDTEPPLTKDLVELAMWLHSRYLCTQAAAVQAVLPSGLRTAAETVYVPVESPSNTYCAGDRPQEPISRDGASKWPANGDREAPSSFHLPVAAANLLERIRLAKVLSKREATRTAELKTAVKYLMDAGLVEARYTLLQSVKPLYVPYVRIIGEAKAFVEAEQSISARSSRRRAVLAWLSDHRGEEWSLRALLTATGATRKMVEQFAEMGLVERTERDQLRDPHRVEEGVLETPLELTVEQQRAFELIEQRIEENIPATILLHGVTGSGKTEIYLQAIASCLALNCQAIVLVPEIALTPQMVSRFKKRFGNAVAVLHSRLSSGEKFDEWRRIRSGQVQIAVGARSAVFAPFARLGLFIIDEEHELSYKQEEAPRYVTREVAQFRARQHGAVVVLGSATPSLDSMHKALHGTYGLATLYRRVMDRPMPEVDVVNMRQELVNGNRSIFSDLLRDRVEARLERREQVVLFLNRRGYTTFILCRSCGQSIKCPDCDVSLTHHMVENNERLHCHYCGHTTLFRHICPHCNSHHIRHFGTGTQKVEEQVRLHFPMARIIRMDVDTTRTKGAHEDLLNRFGRGEADILLGTQMIAKGLDFPRVTLVGVLAADMTLHLPDFRAAERTFQLLIQVAGRAGRHDLPGQVVIQTYSPEHYAVTTAAMQDYDAFYQREMVSRQHFGYPPFRELLTFLATHEQEDRALAIVRVIYDALQSVQNPAFEALSPTAAPFARLRGRYRFLLVVKYTDFVAVQEAIRASYNEGYKAAQSLGGQITVDVDAQVIL